MVVKEGADTVGFVLSQHLLGAPCFRAGFCSKTIIPDSEEHPLASSRAVPKDVLRWIRAKETINAGLKEASGTLEVRGSVIAKANTTGDAIDEITVQVANAAGGEFVDLTPGETIITYTDADQAVTW